MSYTCVKKEKWEKKKSRHPCKTKIHLLCTFLFTNFLLEYLLFFYLIFVSSAVLCPFHLFNWPSIFTMNSFFTFTIIGSFSETEVFYCFSFDRIWGRIAKQISSRFANTSPLLSGLVVRNKSGQRERGVREQQLPMSGQEFGRFPK